MEERTTQRVVLRPPHTPTCPVAGLHLHSQAQKWSVSSYNSHTSSGASWEVTVKNWGKMVFLSLGQVRSNHKSTSLDDLNLYLQNISLCVSSYFLYLTQIYIFLGSDVSVHKPFEVNYRKTSSHVIYASKVVTLFQRTNLNTNLFLFIYPPLLLKEQFLIS